MMRRLLQPFWILLALIFLIEAWLWDHLEPVVARVVAIVPFRAFKVWMAARVARLTPMMTLLVFIAPLVLLFPLKFLEVWLIANQYWVSAIALIVAGKFVGMGILAFIFDVTKPKLLQMAWFVRVYEWVLDVRRRASDLVAPMIARMKATMARFRSGSSSRWFKVIQRMRSRAFVRRV